MDPPRAVSTPPVTSPTTRLFTRLANWADTRDAAVATTMQMTSASHRSSRMAGLMRMWLAEAMRAVKVMMNVLVPTAVFSS